MLPLYATRGVTGENALYVDCKQSCFCKGELILAYPDPVVRHL